MEHPAAAEELRQSAIDRFWETVPPVWNMVRNHLRLVATEKFDVSVEQFHILRHIHRGITSVSELAEVKQISRPAISHAVDILVEKGLITRKQEVDDRRYVKLALTPSGEDLLSQIFRENRSWMASRLSSLEPDELVCMIEGLEVLKRFMAEEDPE